MLLDIYADSINRSTWNPATRWPADAAERLDLAYDSATRTGAFYSRESNRYEAFEAQRQAFRDAGRVVLNPYALPPGGETDDSFPGSQAGPTRDAAWAEWNRIAAELRAASPDGTEKFFTAEEIERQADQRAADARRRAQEAEIYGTGALLPALAGVAGEAGGLLTDPVQLSTLPLGAPQAWLSGGLARRMLVMGASEAAINAGVQAGVQYGAVNPYAREAGFEPDPLEAVLVAGALGGGIGAAMPLFGAAASRLFRRAGADPERAAAARIAEDAATIEASTPAGATVPGHAETLARAESAVAQGTLPVDVAAPSAWATRTAQRLAAGEEAQVFTPAGRAIGVRYELAEADRLVASHTDTMAENPAYPHAEGVQPRDRSTPMSGEQVAEIAGRFQPERLAPNSEAGSGPPIVDSQGIVESGNGRVLALRRILTDPAHAERREAWLAFLKAQGFDPTGMQNPVLVARRTTPLSAEERRAFVREANMPAQAQMTAAETARADAAAVADAIPLYAGGAMDLEANQAFVARFLKSLPQTVRAGLLTSSGAVSQEGWRRLGRAVLAHAYGDHLGTLLGRFVEGDSAGLKAIAGALQDVAPAWSAMRAAATRGEIAPDMDITADLVQAIETVDLARQKGIKVGDLLVQADITRPPLSVNGQAMLNALFTAPDLARQASRQSIADRLSGYADQAMRTTPGVDMFGARAAAPGEVLATAARKAGPATAAEDAVAGPPWPADVQRAIEMMAERRRALAQTLGVPEDQAHTVRINTVERGAIRRKAEAEMAARQVEKAGGSIATDRQAFIVLGPPAAGKSSKIVDPLAKRYRARIIDADDYKELLPEFENGTGAGLVHRESSDLAEAATGAAAARGENIALPLVGQNTAKISALIDDLKADGYTVHLALNELPIEKAVGRAIDRFRETGRLVDPNYVLSVAGRPGKTYDAVKQKVDSYARYSNDVARGRPLQLLEKSAEQADGRGPGRRFPDGVPGEEQGPPRGGGGSGSPGPGDPQGGGVAPPPDPPPPAGGGGAAGVSPFAGRQAAIAEASRQIEASIKLPDAARADLLEAQRVAAAAPDLVVPVGTGDAMAGRGAAELLDIAEAGVQAAEAQAVCLLGAVAQP